VLLLTALSVAPRREGVPIVLLVEDDTDTRLMYAEYLGSSFDVIQAGDGRQALAAMDSRRPDLVITDLSLPHVDGFALIAAMRQHESLRDVPVICLSGYGGDAHEQRARDARCDLILQKPCLPDALGREATKLLRGLRDGGGDS
jgi:DNA-binding response OmpR family regulator